MYFDCIDIKPNQKGRWQTNTIDYRIKIFKLDLASLHSVKAFANTVNKLDIGVDILVNNAGIMKVLIVICQSS